MKLTAPVAAFIALACCAGWAAAQPPSPAKSAPTNSPAAKTAPAAASAAAAAPATPGTRDRAAEIVTQPARDVGVGWAKVPPPLRKAAEAPYSLDGLRNCKQIAAEVQSLNGVLGADFKSGDKYSENRMAKLAEAGGKTVVNSIIPFRGLVREVSGAAPADRRMRAAEDAGLARRGFLRGVYTARSCRPRL